MGQGSDVVTVCVAYVSLPLNLLFFLPHFLTGPLHLVFLDVQPSWRTVACGLCVSLPSSHLYRLRLLLSVLCCIRYSVSIFFPASEVWLEAFVCWCLLLCSYCSCEFSPLNILYCPFMGFWKRTEVNICIQSTRFNEKRDFYYRK